MTQEAKQDLEARPAQETGAEERTLETPQGGEGGEPQGIDPLDQIDDPDALRAEAKKYRGIVSRVAPKAGEEPAPVAPPAAPAAPEAPTPAAPAPAPYLAQKDFEKSNEKKAIREITTVTDRDDEDARSIKEEIDANWDSIRIYYTGRRGKLTPEDIMEDLYDAHAVWKRRQKTAPADPQGEAAREVTASPVARPAGAPRASAPAATKDDDPRFSPPKQPTEWYPKKPKA